MPTVHDIEFGEVIVRRSSLSKYVRVRVTHDGRVSASLPNQTSLKYVEHLIEQSREELRKAVSERQSRQIKKEHGMKIGKSHTLHIFNSKTIIPKNRIANQIIRVELPVNVEVYSQEAQKYISTVIKKVLKKEAKAYLPRRIEYLAQQYNFSIKYVRFNNAKTRWGSCSHDGSINLNVALMQLPFELIDYVIIHELCHTIHLNHSSEFWQLVSKHCPNYRDLRKQITAHHPYI